MKKLHYFHTTLLFFLFFAVTSLAATDTITPITPLTLNQTLVSSGEVFELGFFNPGGNANWYIGIWFKDIKPTAYVWVANRDSPVSSSSPKLTIGDNGNLILLNQANTTIWTTNQMVPVGNHGNLVAQLLDSGNFVLRMENDDNPENYIWESFKNPTDTLLAGMKLGLDRKTGVNRFLRSWKTGMDPGSGDYYFKLNTDGFPEFYILKNQTGMNPVFRNGPWNGKTFSGKPEMETVIPIEFLYKEDADEISFSFEMKDTSVYSRLLMNSSGFLTRFTYDAASSQTWSEYWYNPRDECDYYRKCGPFGVCSTNGSSSICTCVTGFQPKNQQAWGLKNRLDGCIRSSKMDCQTDGFVLLKNMKLPESSKVYINRTISLSECAQVCKSNCSCGAYANTDITGNGSGCVIWTVDLLDMRQYADSEGGQDLYVRVAASDLGGTSVQESPTVQESPAGGTSKNGSSSSVAMIVSIVVGQMMVIDHGDHTFFDHIGHDERRQDFMMTERVVVPNERRNSVGTTARDLELPLFDFSTLVIATNSFSDANKLGQGGFGSVYKGTLMEGQVVAIKRLSRTSIQGIEELKNEVLLIAKLQHRNLVRLLGCCIEVEEKLLVYEYMENTSLDMIIFNKEKGAHLDWKNRFNIISGIARGLLYLHQDSRLKIIHRDLKASNILLDKNMNPKISDFGLARIFGGDQIEAETHKVVGTHGYMSPEYVMDGIFSTKSDVFSFGVLMLEIVSGKKNRGFVYARRQLNLIGHMWNLWREGKALELIDESIGADGFSQDAALRCIHIGLLCAQENAEDRPDMLKVLLMLSGDVTNLPQPNYPGLSIGKTDFVRGTSNKQDESVTINELTATILVGR
ncbi:hypothetical protein SSX86_015592 [Deinandra increscens subsp. villosa]|uniref:Receptor-like serine/threonine-protein kinase n=1 Tax=Deinandra increscens subsp. villosa TaxID=3103831 RepID=A0AAP0GXM6_9ASTR